MDGDLLGFVAADPELVCGGDEGDGLGSGGFFVAGFSGFCVEGGEGVVVGIDDVEGAGL